MLKETEISQTSEIEYDTYCMEEETGAHRAQVIWSLKCKKDLNSHLSYFAVHFAFLFAFVLEKSFDGGCGTGKVIVGCQGNVPDTILSLSGCP
jgi:hypothetical protein